MVPAPPARPASLITVHKTFLAIFNDVSHARNEEDLTTVRSHLRHFPDLLCLAFAFLGTVAICEINARTSPSTLAQAETANHEQAMDGLIDADSAAEVGSWWLDDPSTTASLSFDPSHERLVWRVSGSEGRVLLDAETGEALAFEFERS